MNLLERITWITEKIAGASITMGDEYDLQAGIQAALEGHGVEVRREVRLADGISRIDLVVIDPLMLATTVGIEVKVDGSAADVVRQLTRYSKEPTLDGLVLVTTRSKHHHIPTELNAKPVRLVSLIGAGL